METTIATPYTYADGDVLLEVESVTFRIHSYLLQRATVYFDTQLKAGNIERRIVLDGIKRLDLENLLWFFYDSAYKWSGPVDPMLTDKWESVLLLAEEFKMERVALVACHALERAGALDDIRKIALCMKHVRDTNWAMEALVRVAERQQAISLAEGCQIGVRISVVLATAREALFKSRVPDLAGPCSSPARCGQNLGYSSCHRPTKCAHGVHACDIAGHGIIVCPSLGTLTANEAVRSALLSLGDIYEIPVRYGILKKRSSQSWSARQSDAFFKIENSQFRLHSYHLKRASKVFADMYLLPKPSVETDAQAEESIVLDVKSKDFADLLWFFYDSPYGWTPTVNDAFSAARWESILALADMFDMQEVAQVATSALDRCSVLTDVRKISLCVRHRIDRTWAFEALKNVCGRLSGVSVHEARDMGTDMTALIALAREQFIRWGSQPSDLDGIVREMILQSQY